MKIQGTEQEKQRIKNLLIKDCEIQIVCLATDIRFATGSTQLNIKEVKKKISKIRDLIEEIEYYNMYIY